MPALISVADFRATFDVSNDIIDARITPHIGAASRRLQKWVGVTKYAVALAGIVNADMTADLKNAEAHLAFHFAILGFNSPLSSKGVVATSMSGEGREMRKYLTPAESLALAGQFLEMARSIAGPYLDPAESEASSVEVISECLSYT